MASHADRPHLHCHIHYNSTSLDYAREFRDFIGSARAVRQPSNRMCSENRLSVITNPKRHGKGRFKYYGEWLDGHKPSTSQEKLKAQIDICLAAKPPDTDTFLQVTMVAGYEVKWGCGGAISFRAEEQECFTRLRAFASDKGYGQEDI